jgi:arylsulfatase A-like enzyme
MSTTKHIVHEGLPVSANVPDIAADGDRPNILMICTDQLRADWLGINGHPLCQTPHLDELALNGINFRSAMSECPVCCPARRILMTGLDPFGIHMFQNRDLQEFPEGPKLAELVSTAGYQTHAVGKMHTWPPRNRMGFDDIEVNEEGRTAGHTYPDDYVQFINEAGLGPQLNAHGIGNNQYGFRPSPVPEWATTTGWTADRAMRFLRRRDTTRPFMLYVSFDKPHPPLVPPQEFYDLYRDKHFDEPVIGDWAGIKCGPGDRKRDAIDRTPHVIQESLRAYAACITHIDSRIGQLLGTLRETGVLRNTWIIFTADHGDMTFDHYRRAKGTFLNGSSQVPFIVVPAVSASDLLADDAIGRVDQDHPVGLADFLPTICELTGAATPASIPGRSLVPFFTSKSGEYHGWRDVHFGTVKGHYAAFDGHYRYMWETHHGDELLFDHQQDNKDTHDLSQDPAHAATKEKLRSALISWLQTNDDPHVQNGNLVAIPIETVGEGAKSGYTNGPWNNRGWRG